MLRLLHGKAQVAWDTFKMNPHRIDQSGHLASLSRNVTASWQHYSRTDAHTRPIRTTGLGAGLGMLVLKSQIMK